MHSKKYLLIFLTSLGLSLNIFAQDLGLFEKLNNLFNPYIFSFQQQEITPQQVASPYLQLSANDYNYGTSVGTTLSFNTIYLNSVEKNLLTEQANYSNFNNFLFLYEKINGDFFTLLSIAAENQFLEHHKDLDFDIEARLYTNKLYKEMLISVIYGYSGIMITEEILTEFIHFIDEFDFSFFSVSDIYQIGMVKASELNLANAITLHNNKNKVLYGYLPDFNFGFSLNKGFTKDSTANIQSDVRITIPNLGLNGSVSYSKFGEENNWSSSISLSFPISKRNTYVYQQSEYSFSSENFLINLSGMLFSYNRLKDRTDTEGQYELLMLKTRLLPAIKKYKELY